MINFRSLIYLFLFQLLYSTLFAGMRQRCETIRNENGGIIMFRMTQWWEFDDLNIEGLTLSQTLKKLRVNSGPEDDRDYRVNVVVKWSQLTDAQKNAKIFMDGTGHSAGDVIHVLAMTLGLGYKIEEYAVVIGSRAEYPLPKTKSTELGSLLESIRTEPKILIRFVTE